MSCSQLPLKRGAPATYRYTIKTAAGALRPFAAGEYAVLTVGSVTTDGASVLQKTTTNPVQGETTVGSAVATFYFTADDTNDTLILRMYQADIWIGGNANSPIAVDDIINVTVYGRVNPTPPGP